MVFLLVAVQAYKLLVEGYGYGAAAGQPLTGLDGLLYGVNVKGGETL